MANEKDEQVVDAIIAVSAAAARKEIAQNDLNGSVTLDTARAAQVRLESATDDLSKARTSLLEIADKV